MEYLLERLFASKKYDLGVWKIKMKYIILILAILFEKKAKYYPKSE